MTSTTPTPDDFERQVLKRLDKIDADIQKTNNRLDNFFNGDGRLPLAQPKFCL
jgi:hypothetical protein